MSSDVFNQGLQVDLLMMLEAREHRSNTQVQLLSSKPQASLLSATMNIPGPVKTSRRLREVFEEVLDAVHTHPSLKQATIFSKIYREKATGPEYYLLVDLPAKDLKWIMVDIEESHPWGRLLDLDVLYCESVSEAPSQSDVLADGKNMDREGESGTDQQLGQQALPPFRIHGISRSDLNLASRRCLICEDDAKACGRSRKHSIEEMQAAITQLIENERENVND